MRPTTSRYMLNRDQQDSLRLDEQHPTLTQAFSNGELLHPCIPQVSIPLSVADIGTGTGVWLKDLKTKLPKSSDSILVGFDFSSSQFPSSECEGISFVVHDATCPFPSPFHGVFDVVHLRLLAYALQKEDLKKILTNVLQILKCGGYIEWFEIDVNDMWSKSPSDTIEKVIDLVNQERSERGLVQYIPSALLEAFGLPFVLPVQDKLNSDQQERLEVRILNLERQARNPISETVEGPKQDVLNHGLSLLLQARNTRLKEEARHANGLQNGKLRGEAEEGESLAATLEAGWHNRAWTLDALVIRIVAQKTGDSGH